MTSTLLHINEGSGSGNGNGNHSEQEKLLVKAFAGGSNYGATATVPPNKNSCCDENGNCRNAPASVRKRSSPTGGKSRSNGHLFAFFGSLFETENSRTSVAACCASGTCSYTTQTHQEPGSGKFELSLAQNLWKSNAGSLLPHTLSERSLATDSVGSYNRPTTPVRSRSGSADYASSEPPNAASTAPQMDPSVAQTTVRSTLHCTGICCSSEVPELLEILQPLTGVSEVKVNVPLKQIIVDHDCRVISATQIAKLLELELFPSTIERDGGASLPSCVRSTFTVGGLCCSSEVPILVSVLQPYEGVSDIKFNVPAKQIIVEHNSKVLSASQIASILTEEDFPATVQVDGGRQEVGVEGRSKFYVSGICCSSEIPAIRAILERKNGIRGLIVNVATKMVSE